LSAQVQGMMLLEVCVITCKGNHCGGNRSGYHHEIGRNYHPENPYSSPSVRIINDDARSFFATTAEKFDVISFGLLDSHTTTAMTNARLDHYVYTRESIQRAKSLLADGGIMVLTFEAQKLLSLIAWQGFCRKPLAKIPFTFVSHPIHMAGVV
jgi:hypothetical protein